MVFDSRSHLLDLTRCKKDFYARPIPGAYHTILHQNLAPAPRAISVPFFANMPEGYFKPTAVLKWQFETLDFASKPTLVCYHGSDFTATRNVLALFITVYLELALYPDSYRGWITDPNQPIEGA